PTTPSAPTPTAAQPRELTRRSGSRAAGRVRVRKFASMRAERSHTSTAGVGGSGTGPGGSGLITTTTGNRCAAPARYPAGTTTVGGSVNGQYRAPAGVHANVRLSRPRSHPSSPPGTAAPAGGAGT